MKGALLFATATLATVSAGTSTPFADWVRQHQKNWKVNSAEWEMRKELFTQRVMKINQHNANPKKTYTMGLNKFTASTSAEMQTLTGAVPEITSHHQPKHSRLQNITIKAVDELPESVDWREAGVMSPVKDQGHCGSCWAFSATETMESHVAINTGVLFPLSPQQVASCTDNVDKCGGVGGCSGGMPQVAFDSIANAQHGITTEFEYAYNSYYGEDLACKALSGESDTPTAVAQVDGYVQVTPNSYLELMSAVAQVGPVAIVLDASSFHSYEGGIFDGCDYENIELNHAVQLVGYGECSEHGPYWLVRNSWGPAWGEKGYIRLKRSDKDDELCDHTMNGGRCSGDPLKVDACGTCGILYSPSYPVGAQLYGAAV